MYTPNIILHLPVNKDRNLSGWKADINDSLNFYTKKSPLVTKCKLQVK